MSTREGQQAIYQMVTDKITTALEAGTVPWQQGWVSVGGMPRSMSTGKLYTGVNPFMLNLEAAEKGYTSPWWGTFDKIAELAGMRKVTTGKRVRWVSPDGTPRGVRTGEHSTIAVFWKVSKRTEQNDKGEDEEKKFFTLIYHRVFNAEQADALPERYHPAKEERDAFQVLEAAQAVADQYLAGASAPELAHAGFRAYYKMGLDKITMPDQDRFLSPEDYYDTLFHEIAHSTGHETRLNRRGIAEFDHFGSDRYSKEELVAEMAAAMLNAVTGIATTKTEVNNAAYIGSWLKSLRGDVKLVLTAASAAQSAANLILGTIQE
jgi:antirestriction protein ArdC